MTEEGWLNEADSDSLLKMARFRNHRRTRNDVRLRDRGLRVVRVSWCERCTWGER